MNVKGYKPRVEFICPFCRGKASAGFVCEGASEYPAATHTLPYCQKFESLEADEYWHACAVELRKGSIN